VTLDHRVCGSRSSGRRDRTVISGPIVERTSQQNQQILDAAAGTVRQFRDNREVLAPR